jgi:hypothetical protein
MNNGEDKCIDDHSPCAIGYMRNYDLPYRNCLNCASDYQRDTTTKRCVLIPISCNSQGLIDDGTGKCVDPSAGCALGYRDNGIGICTLNNLNCYTNYKDNG